MILFGLIYPLKQEQRLRTELIEIKEKDSLLQIQVSYLSIFVSDLDTLQRKTQERVNKLKNQKLRSTSGQRNQLDEKIQVLVDKFYDQRRIGLDSAKEMKLRKVKLKYEKNRYDETKIQIQEYFVFKTIFWGFGVILTIAGLFFWMDSTHFDEREKVSRSSLQPMPISRYVVCLSYIHKVFKKILLWTIICVFLLILIIWLCFKF
ncbi:hypothetical protein [Pedobacter sp. ok626]|uniref:hypothetical protein n=1 Tax=Pedobacter sp. ok626 TaxID=1761882 RepID=UPI000B80CC2F|nr:hypothetical protein [Pedobacter sp. ok626]